MTGGSSSVLASDPHHTITCVRDRETVAPRGLDLLALDEALVELAALDEQQARIVELRAFGGLSVEETAEALEISPATVKRHWAFALAWLERRLRAGEPHPSA
jgi:RNA polymerase sigma factor (sigma-70 family)